MIMDRYSSDYQYDESNVLSAADGALSNSLKELAVK